MPDLSIKGLTIEYASGGYAVRAIDALDLDVSAGELVLLLGPSGCGKTTLLSVLAGILKPTSGSVHYGATAVNELRGRDLADYRRSTVGIVFQSFNLIPSLTALENVQVPLLAAKVKAKLSREHALLLLEQVGLEQRMTHKPGDLSGGQQQRVAIARALAHDPPLLLADEPTAHLDYIQVEGILRILRGLAAAGRVVVVATHDERLLPLADRIVELSPKAGDKRGPGSAGPQDKRGTGSAGPQDKRGAGLGGTAGQTRARLGGTAGQTRAPEHLVLAQGDTVFEQGAPGELIYVVWRGEVELFRTLAEGSEQLVERRGQGRYFGELGPIFGLPRSATARAATEAVVTGYTPADFRKQMGADSMTELMLGADVHLSRGGSDGELGPIRRA